MDQQAHYFLSPVQVFDGQALKASLSRALISRSGVYKVFADSEDMARAFLAAKNFSVLLDGIDYRARLVRETGPDGVHYNLHLLRDQQHLADHLKDLISRFGFESPWKRDFARIPSGAVLLKVETPVAAVLNRFSGEVMADVRNFSYHGLSADLFLAGPSLGETVRQKIDFKIVTSKGNVLEGLSGRIARIYDEMVAPGKLKRGLGIRIESMNEESRKAYHTMILESCRELKRT